MQFVLVHGGWQGGWCWDAVAALLRDAGHRVVAPTLRGSEYGAVDRAGITLTDIGDGLVKQIERLGLRDLVLVGHSGGGPVVQYVAERLAKITRWVIFASGWVLRDGESINSVLPVPVVDSVVAAAAASPDNTVPMDPDLWQHGFMGGAPDDVVVATLGRLVPVPIGWLTEPISLSRFWRGDTPTLPASYVLFRDDVATLRSTYATMAERLGVPVVECDGPHEAMLTHPDAVARALLACAQP